MFGFEPLYVLVGPLLIDLGGKGLRVGANPMRRHLEGAVVFPPPSIPTDRLIARWRWMVAAGPGANLGFGLLLFGLASSTAVDWRSAVVVTGVGCLSLLTGALNVLPIATRFGLSDGATLAILARGGEPAAGMVRGHRVASWVMSPTRPADWPAQLIAEAEAAVAGWPRDRPLGDVDERPGAAQVLFYHYADTGRHDRLGALLGAIRAAPSSDHQRRVGTLAGFDVFYALYLAAWAGDASQARTILGRVPEHAPIRANSLWHTAWAAVLLADGDGQRSAESARTARKLLGRFGVRSGADQAEQRWIDAILMQTGQVNLDSTPVVSMAAR